MNSYACRKNFNMTYLDNKKFIHGKLAFKTRELCWLETYEPVIILISVHSAFHDRIWGDFKMNALLSTIKKHVNGEITVLFAECAHIHAHSLCLENCVTKAFEETLKDSYALQKRYAPYLEGCKVVDWHSYICLDPSYHHSLNIIKKLSEGDVLFKEMLQKDADKSKGIEKTFDRTIFIKKTIDDILEQCTSLVVLANKGYRFQFYPGKSYSSVEYIANSFIPKSKISWINVFLTIERKKISDVCCEAKHN